MRALVHVSVVARFAGDGRVWRAFDHLLAIAAGRLVLVPVGLADGDLTGVTDGCPVPWQEVWAVLDALPAAGELLSPERLARIAPLAAACLTPYGWVRDVVPGRATVPTMTRLTAPDGVRLAMLKGAAG